MKPSDKIAFYYVLMGAFVLVGTCAKPLHIPPPWGDLLFIPAGVLTLLAHWENEKIKKEGLGKVISVTPLAAKKKLFWLVTLSLTLGSLGFFAFMPYIVDNYSPSPYYYVVPGQVALISVFLFFYWRRGMAEVNPKK